MTLPNSIRCPYLRNSYTCLVSISTVGNLILRYLRPSNAGTGLAVTAVTTSSVANLAMPFMFPDSSTSRVPEILKNGYSQI